MCEFCVKHGEGKKWYLQVKNYSEDLWNDIKRKKIASEHFALIASIPKREYKIIKFIYGKSPFLGLMLFRAYKKYFGKKHLGQVIPIEEVEKILSIVNSVVRIPCVCRKATTGKDVRYCFAISINPESIGMAEYVDKNYFGGPDVSHFEKFDKKAALDFMRSLEPQGIVHSVWTILTPFVAFICNCGHNGCISMQSFREIAPVLLKSEYLADVKNDLCVGCKKCITVCPFNAIKFDSVRKKAVIDRWKCYGCGICRSVCKDNAIVLYNRPDFVKVSNR